MAGGEVDAATVVGLTEATTLSGKTISIKVVDGGVVLNGSVKVTSTDIRACNGIIHVIDGVLLAPPSGTMPETGSPATTIALLAGALLALGAGGVTVARRRNVA